MFGKPKILEIDGLSYAISALMYQICRLLEKRFKADRQLPPEEHVGFRFEVLERQVDRVHLRILPIGWPENTYVNAVFCRRNRYARGCNWSLSGGSVVIVPLGHIVDFTYRSGAFGQLVLVDPKTRKMLTPEDFFSKQPVTSAAPGGRRVPPDIGSPPGGCDMDSAD